MAELATRRLGRTGLELTELGFGGGPVGWLRAPNADSRSAALIDAAWDAGIRFFDTAPYYGYGRSELRIGQSLRHRPRDAYVLSTKVGRLIRPRFAGDYDEGQVVYDYSYDATMRSIDESLERLGIGRIDIALIHDVDRYTHGERQVEYFRSALEGAYVALDKLRREGVIASVGLGVNEWQVCDAFGRAADIDCVLLAGRHTLLEREAETAFFPMCLERGIGIIIGGPYNSGILATGAFEGALYNYSPASEGVLTRVGRLQVVCDAHEVALLGAALAFPLRHPAVATVIPGIATTAELHSALDGLAQQKDESFWIDLDRAVRA